MSEPVAVLFDVDGTLIDTGGAGARSWRYAFDRLYGVPADIGEHSQAGETDPVVARRTFVSVVGREPALEELARLYAAYLYRLADEVRTSEGYRVLDGVEKLLTRLFDSGAVLGIVSGALEGSARVKLARANLNRFFPIGGYGTDSDDRVEVTRTAIRRVEMLHGHDILWGRVMVVGDTPNDVAAANDAGAVSVAVASGKYSVEELAASGADHVLPSLTAPFPDPD
ncbi:MAG TPA: HAD family hydrolase [Actinomycetota bacterium]